MQMMMRQVPLHRSKPQQRGPLTAQPPSRQQKVRCPANTNGSPGCRPEPRCSNELLCLLQKSQTPFANQPLS